MLPVAPIGVWTNGEQISCYNRKDPNFFEEMSDIPSVNQKTSDITNERHNYDWLKEHDKLRITKRSLRSYVQEMEDEVLASAGVDSFEEIFKLIFTKLYDELICEHDTKVWRVIRSYVGKAHTEKSFETTTKLGIGETSTRKGHHYVTIFADMNNGDVLFATEGKGSSTIESFAKALSTHNANPPQIKEISMDMSPAFIAGAEKYLPIASVTFDKFHVIKQLNEALDEVRRYEQKLNPLLKRSRYAWLKNPNNLTAEQRKMMETLSKENTKTAKVYQMKLTFQDIYRNIYETEAADAAIRKWLSWAVRSRLEPVKEFAKMVKKHYAGILRFFESRLTSGMMEGINSRIQEIKRRAKGFRNINNFITMIYLEAGRLSLPT
jgi:transposase